MAVRAEHHAEPIPGYRLLERLGGGGFGEVWKCEAPGGVLKAMKFAYGDMESLSEDGQRAEQELKALNRVKTVRHPFILSLDFFKVIDGQLIIVMDLADLTLGDRFRDCRGQGLPGIPREELLNYIQETAEALDLMNIQYQLQHLDIKPQNLFLVHNHVKVADFGLVKDMEGMMASVTGGVTPGYAAPETFDGWVSRYCDQYSLAIVFQELLTGQRPFVGTTVRQLVMQHMSGKPNLTPLPAHDQPAIARALNKNPDERFPTCQEFARALRDAAAQPVVHGASFPPPLPVDSESEPIRPAPPRVEAEPRKEVAHSDETPAGADPDEKTQKGPWQRLVKPPPVPLPPLPVPAGAKTPPVLPPTPGKASTPRKALAETPSQTPLATPFGRKPSLSGRKLAAKMQAEAVLLPSLVIGLGQLGLRALKEFRREIHERFGRPDALPNVRLLFLDTDPETTQAALRGQPQTALRQAEVLLTKLHRPSHYLKPGNAPSLGVETWLSPKTLYRMPRQQTASGVRGLGRLAFVDNYPAITRRLEQELQACADPESMEQAVQETGLAVRGTVPRVYLVSGLAGGSGSGMFLDLAYTVRHLLGKLGHKAAEIIGVCLVPGGEDPRRAPELANAFAALTELQHYASPEAVFEAHYPREAGGKAQRLIVGGPPLQRCLLLPVPEEGGSSARVETGDGTPPLPPTLEGVLARAGHFLVADLTMGLGKAADQFRQQHALRRAAQVYPTHGGGPAALGGMVFQTMGVYRLLWPRRQLLDAAARGLCRRLVQRWMTKDAKPLREQVKEWVAQQWGEFGLSQEQLIGRVQQPCHEFLKRSPEEVFAGLALPVNHMLAPLPRGKAAVPPEPALQMSAVLEAMDQYEKLLGIPEECRAVPKPGMPTQYQPGSLENVLRESGSKLVDQFEQKIAELVVYLIETPEARLAGAEETIRQFTALIEQALESHEQLTRELQARAAGVYERIHSLMDQPSAGRDANGSGWRAAFTRRVPAHNSTVGKELLELLRSYPKYRYQCLVLHQVGALYVSLRGLLSDQLREVDFCRTRMTEMHQLLAGEPGSVPARSQAVAGRWLLPLGCATLEEAVTQLDARVEGEQLHELDQQVQELLRKQFRALVQVCMGPASVLRTLVPAIQQEAWQFLSGYLEDTQVAEVYLQQHAVEEGGKFALTENLGEDLQAAFGQASPALPGATPEAELCLLAVPPGDGEQAFRQLVQEALPNVKWHKSPGNDEIVFYREQDHRGQSAFSQFGPLALEAYQRFRAVKHMTPHTRIDIGDWQPLATADQASA